MNPGVTGTSTTPVIPGLMPVDVYLNLTNRGFQKSGPTPNQSGVSFECTLRQDGVEMLCRIEGPNASSVSSVQATFLNIAHDEEKTSELASWFFEFVGTIPYEGANAAANQQWVSGHLDGGSMVDGSVKFELFANAPRLRLLTISAITPE